MSSEVRPRSRRDPRSRLARRALVGCVAAAVVAGWAPVVRADPPPGAAPASAIPDSATARPTPTGSGTAPSTPTPEPAAPSPSALPPPPPVTAPPPPASVVVKQATTPPAAPAARAPAHLGKLEQESVNDALVDLGIRIDWQPIGKTVRAVHVVNQEVFSRRDWWFRWFNIFHRTTRDYIIERELLIHAGDRYDPALVEESVRNLQSTSGTTVGSTTFPAPDLSSVIVIVPVIPPAQAPALSPQPGMVDLLVVTRDVWSLRFNTNFEFQQSTLSSLQTSLSENNLFGWRKFFSFGFSLDLGAYWIGPTYFDPNVLGSRVTLYASANAYYSRDTGRYEGNGEAVSIHYPLFSLASRWGAGLEVVHSDTLVRSFRGLNPRLVNLVDIGPDAFSPTLEAVPYIYRRKITTVDATLTRQFGVSVIQRITLGHHIDSHRSEVPDGFPDPAQAPLFLAQYAPASETRSEPFVAYSLFTPRYAIYRDLNTFDLRENVLLGPTVSASVAYGSPELGADFRAFPMALSLGFSAAAPRGGLAVIALQGSARLRDQIFIDQRYTGSLYYASPMLGRRVRIVAQAAAGARRNDTQRGIFVLGGDTGLRGYAIGDFFGTTEVLGHVELRTAPVAIFSQRIGGLLFYDVGDAAPSFSAITPMHDFGLGLRWLIPQLNSTVIRVDWAFATQSTAFTQAGFPGRVTAGFLQTF
jgi:hypothetical protein